MKGAHQVETENETAEEEDNDTAAEEGKSTKPHTRSQKRQDKEKNEEENTKDEATIIADVLQQLKQAELRAKQTEKDNHSKVQIYKLSGRRRAANCEWGISNTAIHDFTKAGFKDHLGRAALLDTTIDQCMNMFAQFITYVKTEHKCAFTKNTPDTAKIMLWVIDSERRFFSKYSDALSKASMKPCSIRVRLEALLHAVAFLDSNQSGDISHAYGDATRILGNLRKQLARAATSDVTTRDVESLIELNMYPRDGLRQLRENLDDGWEYFDALVGLAQCGYILNEAQYLECLRYVLSTLWGYDGNARALAIEKVCVDDEALSVGDHDFILSQHFKTYAHYKFQTVTFSQIIRNVWIPIIRSQVADKTNCRRIFLSYSGNAISNNDIGRHVQKWFQRYGLVITITRIRKVLEASYSEAERTHAISSEGEVI
jgi:hypothetical protein